MISFLNKMTSLLQEALINSLGHIQSDGDIRGAFQHILNSGVVGGVSGLQPAIDIVETKNNLYVYAELPGVCENSISVDFLNNKITLSGNKIKPYNIATFKKEIIYGRFYREITLPISVSNQKNVNISYKNGIVLLDIDKEKERQNRFSMGINSGSLDNI